MGTTGGTTGTANAACGVDAYSNYAQTFFQDNCVSCHANEGTYAGVEADITNIQSNINSGAMPQGATLAASDKSRILAWIGCGAPQDPDASAGNANSTTGGSGTAGTTGGTATAGTTGGSGTTTGGTTTATTTGSSGTTANCTTDTYSNFAQSVFAQTCTSCHPNYASYTGIQSDSAKIQSQVSQNLMPPSGSPTLTDSDKQRLLTWFSCNLPQ